VGGIIMENDPEFWRTVADRLEDYSIGDCQLQYAWNEYCKDNDVYEQQILLNDSDWFANTFIGLSLEDLYRRLLEEDYNIADEFAREDDYGNPISSNDRAQLISHEEYASLAHWVRVKANKMTKEEESGE
jgi:hypothetical protein